MEQVTEFLKVLAAKGVKLSAEAGRLNCYAQKGALTNEIRDGITKYKSEIIALLENGQKWRQAQIDGVSASRSKEFPLSAGEKGLYILQKLHPELSAYNVPLCFRINSALDTKILGKAWEYTLKQFPILTARVIEKDGDLYHRLDDSCKTTVQQRSIDFADDQQLLPFLRKRVKEPFDLNRGPLTRIELFTQGEQKSILLLTVHHIVFDGISVMILLRSFLTFYRRLLQGEPVRLSHDFLGYQEFVAWEEAMLASREGAEHAAYWRRQLAGELPVIELLPDSSRPASQDFEEKILVENLPEELSHWVRDFAKAHSFSPAAIFLGMFQLLLHKYTNQNDVIVGMPVMGRAAQKFASEIGYFINMIPLRARFEEGLKLSEFLRRAQRAMLDALYHSSYPFPLMLEKLKTKQAGKNPIFQVTYAYQNFINQADVATLLQQQSLGLDIEYVTEIVQEEDSDLEMEIFEKEALFSVRLKYNPELYSRHTIKSFFEHYQALLKGASENQDLLLHEYSIVTRHEKHRLLVEWNQTAVEFPRDRSIHALFEEQVERAPDAVAVVFQNQGLSYRQLNAQANRLARSLVKRGVGPEVLVAVLAERGLDFLITMLAVFKAGGAYLPLDPHHPAPRIGQTLGLSGAPILLTVSQFGALAEEAIADLSAEFHPAVLLFEELLKESHQSENLGRAFLPEQLAYVIFTSGSTGVPKGAMVEHRGMLNHLFAKVRDLPLSEKDVIAQTASQCFDISVWQFLAALLVGGQTQIFEDEITHDPRSLLDQIGQHRVTILEIVPSMMRMMLAEAAHRIVKPDLSTLRWLIPTGEALAPELCREWFGLYPEIPLLNAYGPTECSDDVTHCPIEDALPESAVRSPIGRPIANTQIYVLNPGFETQPIGIVGELYVGGVGVGRGYLNNAEKTAESYVPDGFAMEAGARLYKSGDLARYLPDGNLEYHGRIDHQVKIRGYRIELGEIEAALSRHPSVEEVVVMAREDAPGEKRLVAYLVAKAERTLSIAELREYLKGELPEYMAPTAYVTLDSMPLTENGKLDRQALPAPDMSNVEMESGYVAPRTLIEQRLSEIWSEVLGLDRVGINDDFFELGGHSLLATQLVSKIRSRLDVDLPLKAVFERGSVAQLAQLVAKAEKSDIPPIRPVDRTQFDRLPLSFAQDRLWFINQLDPDSAGYNFPGAVTISGEVDIDQLEEAFNLIIARHENLRTLFPSQDGQAHQLILDSLDFKLERIDLSHYKTREERDDKAKQLCQADAATPFDLARGPLIRGKVIKLAAEEHILMLNMHHIISDGWSVVVLIKEFGLILEALRQGRQAALAPLPIQYVDYSVWQRQWLEEGGALKRRLAYWQEKLAGVPESLDLPTDYPRPSVQSFAGATQTFGLDAELTGRLKSLAEQEGGTLYMVLLAVFKVLLHRYTGQNDLCVGSPIANRQYAETEGLIGMFVNTLALRSRVEGDDTFVGLLSQLKGACLEAYEHQDAPFEKVVEIAQPQRNMAVSPIFQVMLILQNVDEVAFDQRFQHYPLEIGVSKFDLSAEFTETQEGLAGAIEYSTALYKPQTIERMVEHFTALCRAIITAPTARIRDLDYLSEVEKRLLLVDYNATRAEYPKDKCIHHLFEEQVAINPDGIAVVCGDEHLTYRRLYARSRELALYLQSEGVGPESLIGLCLERSPDMVVGLLGILQAGGAYVPLDPDYPAERLAYMLQDSRATIVLTQEKYEEKVRSLLVQDTKFITIDKQWPEVSKCVGALKTKNIELRKEAQADHLAYVIYTSGTTGNPKGVAVTHRSVCNQLQWAEAAFNFSAADRFLQKATFSFDASVIEIFLPLVAGGQLIAAQAGGERDAEYLVELVAEEGITCIDLSPSLLQALLIIPRITSCNSVRLVFSGGEVLRPELVEAFASGLPHAQLWNTYGPTETTVQSTFASNLGNARIVPIGKPLANTQVYVTDRAMNPQPIGVGGELYIGGAGLARGYWERPDLTAARFLPDPFGPHGGARLYRTGDLTRWLDDGDIQYLGRIDTQVKIRGFRIEMGEIETRLNQHPGIQDSAVIARGAGADNRLIAFYQAKDTAADQIVHLSYEELRAHLLQTLPEYMAPAAFVSLAAIPLSPNGKVDRRALARMDVAIESGREYLAPRGETEKRLVEIWSEVLNLAPEKLGVNDNFFELGGHSLLATQLVSKIRGLLDVDVPLKALFEGGSVAQLAQLIAKAEKNDIPPIRPVDRTQFDRLPLSFAQERLWFIDQLEPQNAGYNIPGAGAISGEMDIDQLEEAFNLIIARHENLRTLFPSQDGQAHQLILDSLNFKLERIDLSHYKTREERDVEARRLCQTDAATPFDLAQGPLIRGKAIKLAAEEHILMLNMHHIVSDGWSIGALIKELDLIMEAFREGRRPELRPLPIQYVDYSVWQRQWLEEGGVLKRRLAYWQEKLAGVPESLDLPTDYPRPSVQSFAGATQTFGLDAQLTAQLKRLAEQEGGTLYMVLLAVFKVLLQRYTGQNDICVGSPIANRQYGETEGLIGMFVNLLALRSRVESDNTFAALLSQVKNTCLEAYQHQDAPFEKVVDLLQPQRNLAITPLFQVTLSLQNAAWAIPNPSIQHYPLDSGISKFDLGFDFIETTEGLGGLIEYSAALYKPQTIERMVEHFIALCRAITTMPSAKVGDLDYLSEAEKRELLVGFNDTHADFPKDKCIHQLFVEQVARCSEKTAVVCGKEGLTYQELYARSRDLALYLQSEGVGPDTLVGLCMERSLEMVVGLLGILQAGGAYAPLDPDYPDERLTHMLLDSRTTIVLTQEKLLDKLATLVTSDTRLVALDRRWSEIEDRVAGLKAEDVQLQEGVEPHHLAYVIYTSGSTGRPKGVMNEHRGVVNRLIWMQRAYRLDMEDAVLQKTPFSFDVSVWEFFWPLLAGAKLVMARPEGHKDPGYLVDTIRRNRITTLHFVPPMLQVFLEHEEAAQCLSLTRVICSGEALPSMLVRRFAERLPHAKLYNLYGPTEAAVDVTAWTCPSEEIPSIIPIGRPIANTRMYILDERGALVPIGVAGELHIGGVQVARGYLNRLDLTAERFVRDPFSAEAEARMYKTGDLARWREDGTIEFLGRNDFQVKIRGFRIELGEIEARLMEHEGLLEAVVVAREDTPGEKRLVAYYTPSPTYAFPVIQLLRLRKTDAGASANYCTLPNGLTVFHQNQSETDFVYDEIFKDDGYLKHGVTLNDGDCVFDVGANIGLFSLFVGQRCRNATIYAFEPIPSVFETLRLNSRLHDWAGTLYECGLAERSKQQVFNFYPHNTVISSSATSRSEARQIVKSYLLERQEGSDFTNGRTAAGDEGIDELLEARLESEEYTCQMRTVSEIIEENSIERIDLLKIDVEKAEYAVLKGIEDCDWPKIRQLVIEVHDVSGRLGEIVALLEARGYEVSYEQSQSLQHTGLYNLYACRPGIGKGSSNGNEVGKRVDAERYWGSPESLVRDMRAFLSERLPEYMTPAAYVPLEEMPLTPNGKLDRKALPAPEAGSVAARAYEPPQGEIEATLARVWSDVLKVERIGRNDNFFELGGHSLLAAQLMAKTNRHFKQLLPLAVLFSAPNVAAFAKLISSEEAPSFDILVPIQTNGDAPPVFAVPGIGGNVLSLQPLSKALGAKQPFYGLQAVGLDGNTQPFGSVEQTAQANIAALKAVQPSGPYNLIGHSYGGVVAYEMARILLERGEGISSLILLDSIAPAVMQGEPANDEATDLFEACATMANLYGARLEIDLNRLRQSSGEENVQYIVNLLNDHGLEINDRQFAAFQHVFRANQLCYRAYKPPTLSCKIDVSLYRATSGRQDGPTMPRDYGWNQLLQSPIRIYDLEANHFSILDRFAIAHTDKPS